MTITEAVIPERYGKGSRPGNKILLKRLDFNTTEMSNRLSDFINRETPPDVARIQHLRIYAVKVNGRYARAMLKFHRYEQPVLTLVDQVGPLIYANPGARIKLINDNDLKTEKFGLIKLKLYGLEDFNLNEDVQRKFDFYIKGISVTAIHKLDNPESNPVNHLYSGDIWFYGPEGRLQSFREVLIRNQLAVSTQVFEFSIPFIPSKSNLPK